MPNRDAAKFDDAPPRPPLPESLKRWVMATWVLYAAPLLLTLSLPEPPYVMGVLFCPLTLFAAVMFWLLFAGVFLRRAGASSYAAVVLLAVAVSLWLATVLIVLATLDNYAVSYTSDVLWALAVAAVPGLLGAWHFVLGRRMLRWSDALDQKWAKPWFCDACGYDLRGTIPAGLRKCPECGAAISDAQAQAFANAQKMQGTP